MKTEKQTVVKAAEVIEENTILDQVIDNTVKADSISMLYDQNSFNHLWRVGNMFANSDMVPKHFKGKPGDCVIALDLADRMKINPYMLMQKMYVIYGKPGIEAQLAIALVNTSGKFTPLEYKMSGTGDNETCVVVATHIASGNVCEGPPVSIEMAKKEGWYQKDGSKWKTMPKIMMRYRAAMFFARLHCPERLLGLQSVDELKDIGDTKVDHEKNFEKQHSEHANKDEIDVNNVQKQETDTTESKHADNVQTLTDAEKAEIEKGEAGPNF